MLTALAGARILTPHEEIDDGVVLMEDGRIVDVGPEVRVASAVAVTDLHGLTLVPGFVDLHVHGGGGFSLATRDPDEIRSYARWVARSGVTSFLASIVAHTVDAAETCLRAVAEVAGPMAGGASLIGAHLEGPFVNPVRRGALPESWLRPPDVALLRRLLDAAAGNVRLLTLAPELGGAGGVIAEAANAGCVVAVGHSDASYEQARQAFSAGAQHLTHAFNAMRPLHHRQPGPSSSRMASTSTRRRPACCSSPRAWITLRW
jgi:N-acetylglucosamine-6-phosphate deacetylase